MDPVIDLIIDLILRHHPCLQVSFTSNKIFCDVAVESIMHTQKNTPVKYSFKKFLQTAEYIVQ